MYNCGARFARYLDCMQAVGAAAALQFKNNQNRCPPKADIIIVNCQLYIVNLNKRFPIRTKISQKPLDNRD